MTDRRDTMTSTCPACACADLHGSAAHAVAAALASGDLDRAIDAGLLEVAPCKGCDEACTGRVIAARDARLAALAARERYRARQSRLQRRAGERAAARAIPIPAVATPEAKPALPSAAAAALARAKAKAAERRKP